MAQVIRVKHLSLHYGKSAAPVLDDISVDFQSGEIVGLIGPSGAGKSTFINAILGLLKTDHGTIQIFDSTIPNREVFEKIGYTGQSDALFSELTGRQNLEFFGNLQGISSKKLAAALDKAARTVKLTKDLDKKLSAYSGGMRRRLSLAIALQVDAPLIILDEPTVGIDPELRSEIWVDLKRCADAGKAILITTHVMDEAERCDKILLLREGKLVAQGSPLEIKEKYASPTIEGAFIKAGHKLETSIEKSEKGKTGRVRR